jgi:hypothetical protein
MKRARKAANRLHVRQKDWEVMMNTRNTAASGVQQRKDSGGYKKPGSMQ